MKGFITAILVLAVALATSYATTAWAEASSNATNGVVNIRSAGATGDGVQDDAPVFLQVLANTGSVPVVFELAQGVFSVSDIVFPEHATLLIRNGARLAPRAGAVVEIQGAIEAGIHPIFSGEGRISGAIANHCVYPQWFGAKGDGAQDDSRAMQQAAELAANAAGRTLFIPRGTYRILENVAFRCNVECQGMFIKEIEIDEERTTFCNDLFLPTHYPRREAMLRFESDAPEIELASEQFMGIAEGDMAVPVARDLVRADGQGAVNLEVGATLRFYSSDFFSSRNVRKGAHYYDKNDICQVASGRGDVFPEFAFSYGSPPNAEPWREDRAYVKGDYCTLQGEVFKATWASGPGAGFRHAHLGEIAIGPMPPKPGANDAFYEFTYPDGTADSILLWRRAATQVWYRPKDAPLTVNGLRMEVRLLNHEGKVKRIETQALAVNRSNMTFNQLEITVRDPEALLSQLLQSANCVNVEFNRGFFSGATSPHLGYNILSSNVANMRYNDCISTNSRKGMDSRHGKNIAVVGGFYNIIDDHYGRNYIIRDVTLNGLSVMVPGDSSPRADLQAWRFSPRGALGFNGANFLIENITIIGGRGGVMSARTDVGDLYGDVVLRNIRIRRNEGDVQLFAHFIDPNFDYGHDVKVPSSLTVENVRMENPGKLHLLLGRGFGDRSYGPVSLQNVQGLGNIFSAATATSFSDCLFEDSKFMLSGPGLAHLRNCTFSGNTGGLSEENIGIASGNVAIKGASCPFPMNYINPEAYETSPEDADNKP